MLTAESTRVGRIQLDALTGVRFLASSAIVYQHMSGSYGTTKSAYPLHMGVMVFFILSGFILTHVYPTMPSVADARRFLLARFARIWPLHAVCFALPVILYLPFPSRVFPVWATTALFNITLMQSWIPTFKFALSFNAVSWTISVETFFYLLFPLLIIGFARSWAWKLALAFFGLVFLVALSASFQLPKYAGDMTIVTSTSLVSVTPLSRLFEFVIGMCCCLAWKKWRHLLPTRFFTATLLEGAIFAALICAIIMTKPFVAAVLPIIGPNWGEWFSSVGSCLPFAVLFLVVLANGAGLFGWLLASRPLVFLGEISFATYMIHQIIQVNFALNFNALKDMYWLSAIALYLSLVFVASVALHYGIERPARRYLTRPRPANGNMPGVEPGIEELRPAAA